MPVDLGHPTAQPEHASVQSSRQTSRVIVFSRYPEPGLTKTRLIPALGAERAAQLQRALTRRILSVASQFCAVHACDLEVRFSGGDRSLMGSTFGIEKRYVPQQGCDLGERLNEAISAAFNEGVPRVLVIGSDCPEIEPPILEAALESLSRADVVLGPAIDGGYYLIGLKANRPQLFQGIDWGCENVLRQTIAKAKQLGCRMHQLLPLSDVDYPEDLVACRRLPMDFLDVLPETREGLLSIIVPTLNEERRIEQTLREIVQMSSVEVIVADGGSDDATIDIARRMGAMIIPASPGRGHQMNAGAALASGDILLFLHADTQLPAAFGEHIRSTLSHKVIAGAFGLRIDSERRGLRWIELGVNLRSRFLQRPYGDQGLFISAKCFYDVGGFPNWPLMEDYEFVRRLRKHGKVSLAPAAVTTSARRWLRLGLWRTTLINQLCVVGFCFGVTPETLARWYRSRR